jgi:hypothetical protein
MIITAHTFIRGRVGLTIHYGSRTTELELTVPDSSQPLAEVCEPLLQSLAEEVLDAIKHKRWRYTATDGPNCGKRLESRWHMSEEQAAHYKDAEKIKHSRDTPAAKALLKEALRDSKRVRYLDHIGESGHRLFQIAEDLGLEGIVAKHGGAPYRRGRSSGWIKIKTSAGRHVDEQRAKWNE